MTYSYTILGSRYEPLVLGIHSHCPSASFFWITDTRQLKNKRLDSLAAMFSDFTVEMYSYKIWMTEVEHKIKMFLCFVSHFLHYESVEFWGCKNLISNHCLMGPEKHLQPEWWQYPNPSKWPLLLSAAAWFLWIELWSSDPLLPYAAGQFCGATEILFDAKPRTHWFSLPRDWISTKFCA